MATRTAAAIWEGNLRDGRGTVKLGSGMFEGAYSFASRFESGQGTNPEELIAAAHAGCFSMAFSAGLNRANYSPVRIQTTASVTVEMVGDGHQITEINLQMEAEVPGIDNETFLRLAEAAKTGCPVSKALAAVPKITLDARLLAPAG